MDTSIELYTAYMAGHMAYISVLNLRTKSLINLIKFVCDLRYIYEGKVEDSDKGKASLARTSFDSCRSWNTSDLKIVLLFLSII